MAMKRFFLSALSVVLAVGTVAPNAQALPQVDSAFSLQTIRLSEFDVRNRSGAELQPYGWQPSRQNDIVEQESSQATEIQATEIQATESTVWETSENYEEDAFPALSVTERRHQALDRS